MAASSATRTATCASPRSTSAKILKAQVTPRLQQLGIKTTIVEKNIGYELRCADPIPFDMEYTRDLGYCAAKFLVSGGNARDGLHAGRPLRPRAVRDDDRQRDGADARAPGRHRVRRATPSRAAT